MVAKVGVEPWASGWNKLTGNSHASLSYTPTPQAVVYRNDGVHNDNVYYLYNDVAAAYACALRWKVSGNTAYADKAVQIMNAWSSTLTGISWYDGHYDGFLVAGIQGYQFANAGEIMRTYSGWAAADFLSFQNMMRNVFYPMDSGFTGSTPSSLAVYSSWDLCAMAAVMAIGVLCDDQTMFNATVSYFKTGLGNGAIAQMLYWVHPGYLGQTQETGRDQGHNTLSLTLLSAICEMAWNQGVDLYGYDNNACLAAAEYIAKGNLIESGPSYYSVPFATYANGYVTDTAFSTAAQGTLRPAWALIYHHYVNRKGLAAPYTQKMMALVQPEGGATSSGGYDQLGYGTLAFTRDAITSGAAPSGLTALISNGDVVLSWWGTAYATSYTVKRSTSSGGTYTTITSGITDLLTYTDSGLTAGTYYYVVTATTPSGETTVSNEAKAVTDVLQLQTYLAFNDGSGTTTADSSGNGHAGTLVGGASWTTGKKGAAVALNGSNGYVSLPVDMLLDVSDFTLATWVYWNGANSGERIFDFGSGPTHNMYLTPRAGNGVMRFGSTLTGWRGESGINSNAALPSGQWVHVALTLAGTTCTLYVNGSVVGTNTAMQFAPFRLRSTSQNWIGRSQYSGDAYFGGSIDEFRIYRGALSAVQLATLIAS